MDLNTSIAIYVTSCVGYYTLALKSFDQNINLGEAKRKWRRRRESSLSSADKYRPTYRLHPPVNVTEHASLTTTEAKLLGMGYCKWNTGCLIGINSASAIRLRVVLCMHHTKCE
jgi:hypothetical protein